MDVRCDRCETEYELDDDSVTEGGASVQCTTCGHTFVVGPDGVTIAQIVPTPPGGLVDLGPQAADWLLATEDGQTHRFRDLTTLQKWVVERKATREDRVSRRGGPWLPLGEVDELAPFFAVVDQADRARSPEGARRSGGRDADGLASHPSAVSRPGSRRRENGVGGDAVLSARVDSGPTPSRSDTGSFSPEDERGDEKFETITLFRRSRNVKIAGAAGFVALAIVAAIVGFRRPQWSPVKPAALAHTSDVPAGRPATPPAPPAAGGAACRQRPRPAGHRCVRGRLQPHHRLRSLPPRARPPSTATPRPRNRRSPRPTSGWSPRRIA